MFHELYKKLRQYGQEHLVDFWNDLTDMQRANLLKTIK